MHVVWLEMDPTDATPRDGRSADHHSFELRQRAWPRPRDDPCSQSETREASGSDVEQSSGAASESDASLLQVEVQMEIVQQKMEKVLEVLQQRASPCPKRGKLQFRISLSSQTRKCW